MAQQRGTNCVRRKLTTGSASATRCFIKTRVLVKQEKRKQKEYFEKKRLKSKMKLLGVLSPAKSSTVSLDLLNLYIVNQISCKKEMSETVNKPVHVNMNRSITVSSRNHDLELPMSPNCIPSKLCIDDTENNMYFQRLGNKKETGSVQSSNGNYSSSLLTKLSEGQDAFSSSYNTAQFGTLSERLNRSGNGGFHTERPTIMNEDSGSMNERRESDFSTGKQTRKPFLGENREKVLNCFKDMNQLPPSIVSENCDSFISQNMINLLNLDKQQMKDNISSMGDICTVSSSSGNDSTDRYIRSICTIPELTFSSSPCNRTYYPEKCQPNKNYQKESNNSERNYFSTSFEKHFYPASSEKTGKYENYQEKLPEKTIQKYPGANIDKIPLEELHSENSWDIGPEEEIPEERGMFSLDGRLISTKKIYLDSSQSSQYTNYSPRQTDSCFSSSSEMPSEDEDQILKKSEDSDRRFIKTKETTNNTYANRMLNFPYDRIIKDNDNIHKQSEFSHQFSIKIGTDQPSHTQSNSEYTLQRPARNNCLLQVVKCDAWVQTESRHIMEEKLDAAIQCDIISKCKCRNDAASLCNIENCTENTQTGTTGGQDTLKNN
ncbi:regulator of DNA class I crossover intermediates 1 [Tenrec ecaudatus]|uniref:regulator of DNA class I crossover intermediates 1 n=1 Tax=Tenrec ecaudatus TaxID=94439 RepID=UPI003F590CE0